MEGTWKVPPGEHWKGEEIHISKSSSLHSPYFQTPVLSLVQAPVSPPDPQLLLLGPSPTAICPKPYAFPQTKDPTTVQLALLVY